MKQIVLLMLMVAGSFTVPAQQDPLYSQYLFNPFVINPAYAGFSKDVTGMASYRRQWAGFDGSPVTMNASGHIALVDNRMGLGFMLLQDKIGTNTTTEIMASYGYHVSLRNDMRLSFGLQGGMVNYRNDYSDLIIDTNDPKFQGSLSEFNPSIGAGFIVSSPKFYVSLSAPKLLEGKAISSDNTDIILYSRQFYGLGSFVIPLSHRLKAKPFALVRYTAGAPVNADLGCALNADDAYTLGLFTRNMETYGAMVKIHLGDMLRVGYIFELPTNKSVGTNFTTHEFMVGIRARLFRFHDLSSISDF
jgi:type IX secretion system PorP/SprF family membrane protein